MDNKYFLITENSFVKTTGIIQPGPMLDPNLPESEMEEFVINKLSELFLEGERSRKNWLGL